VGSRGRVVEACGGDVGDRLDAYMRAREAEGFLGALLVIQDSSTVHAGGFGMANQERGIRNTDDPVLPFGSIVKDFTRPAILDLEIEGLPPRVGRLERENQIIMTSDVESGRSGTIHRVVIELIPHAPFCIASIRVPEGS